MSMCDDIADYLATQSFGVVGTSIFVHSKPPTPAAAMSVHQFRLGPPTLTMNSTVIAEYPGLQIQTRDVTHLLAEATCVAVYNKLNGITNTVIGGGGYLGIIGRASPAVLTISQTNVTYYCEFAVTRAGNGLVGGGGGLAAPLITYTITPGPGPDETRIRFTTGLPYALFTVYLSQDANGYGTDGFNVFHSNVTATIGTDYGSPWVGRQIDLDPDGSVWPIVRVVTDSTGLLDVILNSSIHITEHVCIETPAGVIVTRQIVAGDYL